MTLNMFVKVFQCLAAVMLLAFAGALMPLRGQDRPAPIGDSRSLQLGIKPVTALPTDAQDYEICSDDLLDVDVYDIKELSREYRVSPNGSISLPLLPDSIHAAGLTLPQLSDAISKRLRTSRLVANPRVTIQVKESRIHSVAITGAVKRPQIYPVFGATTLLDLLSQAEGLDDDAGSTAIITRGEIAQRRLGLKSESDNNQQANAPTLVVDLKRLLGGGTESNPVLYPGDRVTVPHAGVFYVLGAVNKPGGYNLRDSQERLTVLMALAVAGDLTSTAKSGKCMLIRQNALAPGGREEITLNVKEIVAGRSPDQRMQAEDVLFVPVSGGKKAAHAMLSAVGVVTTTTTSGVLVYRR